MIMKPGLMHYFHIDYKMNFDSSWYWIRKENPNISRNWSYTIEFVSLARLNISKKAWMWRPWSSVTNMDALSQRGVECVTGHIRGWSCHFPVGGSVLLSSMNQIRKEGAETNETKLSREMGWNFADWGIVGQRNRQWAVHIRTGFYPWPIPSIHIAFRWQQRRQRIDLHLAVGSLGNGVIPQAAYEWRRDFYGWECGKGKLGQNFKKVSEGANRKGVVKMIGGPTRPCSGSKGLPTPPDREVGELLASSPKTKKKSMKTTVV